MVMATEAILEMIGIGIIPVFITVIAYPEKIYEYQILGELADQYGITSIDTEEIIYIGSFIMIFFFVLKNVFVVTTAYLKARYAHNRSLRMSKQLFQNYLNMPYVFHLENSSAVLIRNISSECTLLANRVLLPMIDFISQFLVLAGISFVLLISVPFSILAWLILFLGLGMGSAVMLNKRVRLLGEEAQESRSNVLRIVKEALEGVKEIKLLQRLSFFTEMLGKHFARLLRVEIIMNVINVALPNMIELVAIIGLLGVTVMLFASGQDPESVIPILSIFVVALVRMKGSLRWLMNDYTQIQHSGISLDVVYAGLQLEPHVDQQRYSGKQETIDEMHDMHLTGELELKGVSYCYPNSKRKALDNVNLTIFKGEAIGIVGTTGAGKSTLVDIILGVLNPQQGSVTVDGNDISTNLTGWQKQIGYIPQMIFLLDSTLKQNIALGMEQDEIDDNKIDSCIAAAHLTPLVKRLPQGAETIVGERGIRLSGGERQRIAIARALYNDPDLLIMDEGTSSLDNVTEKKIIQEVNSLKGDRTVFMVAHRLSTVRRCDRIIFLKNGRIDAIGSYDKLVESHPEFMQMTDSA
jgi:ATP-binding cassette subfamily C protein